MRSRVGVHPGGADRGVRDLLPVQRDPRVQRLSFLVPGNRAGSETVAVIAVFGEDKVITMDRARACSRRLWIRRATLSQIRRTLSSELTGGAVRDEKDVLQPGRADRRALRTALRCPRRDAREAACRGAQPTDVHTDDHPTVAPPHRMNTVGTLALPAPNATPSNNPTDHRSPRSDGARADYFWRGREAGEEAAQSDAFRSGRLRLIGLCRTESPNGAIRSGRASTFIDIALTIDTVFNISMVPRRAATIAPATDAATIRAGFQPVQRRGDLIHHPPRRLICRPRDRVNVGRGGRAGHADDGFPLPELLLQESANVGVVKFGADRGAISTDMRTPHQKTSTKT